MIPAKIVFPSCWTRDYLTTNYDGHEGKSSYTCLDNNPEVVPGTSAHNAAAFLYYTITTCNDLSYPPYENNWILSMACVHGVYKVISD
jgi:hypothetical protein